jgi:BASS family bile acid:Na+ symporter
MPPLLAIPLVALFIGLAVASRFYRWLGGLGFTFMVLAFGTTALAFPALFLSWGDFDLKLAIAPLVQLILLGMGMTLSFDDFKRVLKMPGTILIGTTLQYLIMPLGACTFAWIFGLRGEVAAGLILLGSCPGGVTSNVIVFLARANVPLSVTLTAVSTLLAPLMTPLAMKLLAGTYVPIAFVPMMLSILKMIIAPLLVGLLIHHFLPRVAAKLAVILPALAMLAICTIIAITIAHSRDALLAVGLMLFGASVCHNATGYLLGYYSSRALGFDVRDSRTVAIEVGLQNGGMATGLAFNVLHSAQAALASATFGPWSAISSSALASWWSRNPAGAPKIQPS